MILARQKENLLEFGIPTYDVDKVNVLKAYRNIPMWCEVVPDKSGTDSTTIIHPTLGLMRVKNTDIEWLPGQDEWTLSEMLSSRDTSFKVEVLPHGVFVSHPSWGDYETWYRLTDVISPSARPNEMIEYLKVKVHDLEIAMKEMEETCNSVYHDEEYHEAGHEYDILKRLIKRFESWK